jgi:uncharacterized protein (TIGR02266 family)
MPFMRGKNRDARRRTEDLRTENRKHVRVLSRLRCWCEADNITLYSRVGNLSEGGMFLRTSTPLEMGARMKLRLHSPGSREVQTRATVVWNRDRWQGERPAGMGLKFEGMDSEALEELRRIISAEGQKVFIPGA